jgi:hypothetical protein
MIKLIRNTKNWHITTGCIRMHTSNDFLGGDYFIVCKSALLLLNMLHGVHR